MNSVDIPEAIAVSAVLCAKELMAQTIVCLSTTGKTAQMISKYRPKARMVAVTAKSEALCKLELCWGVQTLKITHYDSTEEAIANIEDLLIETKIVSPGEPVVLTMGVPTGQGHKTNAVRVFIAGEYKGKTKNKLERPPARFIPL